MGSFNTGLVLLNILSPLNAFASAYTIYLVWALKKYNGYMVRDCKRIDNLLYVLFNSYGNSSILLLFICHIEWWSQANALHNTIILTNNNPSINLSCFKLMVLAMTFAQFSYDASLFLFNFRTKEMRATQLFIGIFCGTAAGKFQFQFKIC